MAFRRLFMFSFLSLAQMQPTGVGTSKIFLPQKWNFKNIENYKDGLTSAASIVR